MIKGAQGGLEDNIERGVIEIEKYYDVVNIHQTG